MTKTPLFAIFAHPDDEAFGPSGTLYKRAQAGDPVHIICITDGSANGDKASTSIRAQEFRASCALIGAIPHQFSFVDGGAMQQVLYKN